MTDYTKCNNCNAKLRPSGHCLNCDWERIAFIQKIKNGNTEGRQEQKQEMETLKLYLVFYDDFSGVDKIFTDYDQAELYKKWSGATADIQKHEVNTDFDKIFTMQNLKSRVVKK